MAAALPHQARLDGIAPAAAPMPPTGAVHVALLGELLAHAVVREGTHGAVKIEVLLLQKVEHHPQATPVLAVLQVPEQGSFAATYDSARLLAARLPQGELAMVTGHGIEPGRHLGADVLRLLHTSAIRPLAAAMAESQPRRGGIDTEAAHAH